MTQTNNQSNKQKVIIVAAYKEFSGTRAKSNLQHIYCQTNFQELMSRLKSHNLMLNKVKNQIRINLE